MLRSVKALDAGVFFGSGGYLGGAGASTGLMRETTGTLRQSRIKSLRWLCK